MIKSQMEIGDFNLYALPGALVPLSCPVYVFTIIYLNI